MVVIGEHWAPQPHLWQAQGYLLYNDKIIKGKQNAGTESYSTMIMGVFAKK